MSAIVSLLWEKNEGVLVELLADPPAVLFTHSGYAGTSAAFRERATQSGTRVELLDALVTAERRRELAAQAKEYAETLIAGAPWTELSGRYATLEMDPETLRAHVARNIEVEIAEGMYIAEEIAAVAERMEIELLVLNEDVIAQSKSAAMWAQAHDVPVLQLAHSCALVGKLRTNHREFHSDVLAVFGERGRAPYREMGISDARMPITGNPAWDQYALLVQNKDRIRAEARLRYGCAPGAHLVLFATTFVDSVTAFSDPLLHDRSIKDVFLAFADVLRHHPQTVLIVKGRSNQPHCREEASAAAASCGVPESAWRYDDHRIEPLIVAADAVISVDSNTSIEAMLAEVPALNYWRPASWIIGPFFVAEDGVLDVSPKTIAAALHRLFSDASLAMTLRSRANAKRAEFAGPADAGATKRVAALIQRTRRRGSSSRPYVSSLATRRDDPADVAHGNLIEILATAPKRVLDLAAGSGASGEALKRRWPGAHVTGIHANASAASAAAGKLDASLVFDPDIDDIGTCGLAPQSIDTVLFPDVVHRLRDPWRLLAGLRPFLAPGAQLVANIPNMRLITLVQSLAAGDLTYTEGGAFDPRNLRFFTLLGIHALFRDTGYRIARVERDFDPSLAHLIVAPGARATINTPALQFKDLGEASLLELRTLQYRVVAHSL